MHSVLNPVYCINRFYCSVFFRGDRKNLFILPVVHVNSIYNKKLVPKERSYFIYYKTEESLKAFREQPENLQTINSYLEKRKYTAASDAESANIIIELNCGDFRFRDLYQRNR